MKIVQKGMGEGESKMALLGNNAYLIWGGKRGGTIVKYVQERKMTVSGEKLKDKKKGVGREFKCKGGHRIKKSQHQHIKTLK